MNSSSVTASASAQSEGKKTKNIVKRVLDLFAKNAHWRIGALIVLLIISAIVEMVGVGLIVPLITVLNDTNAISNSPWLGQAYQLSGAANQHEFIYFSILLLIAFYVGKNILLSVIIFWQSLFLARSEAHVAKSLLNRYITMPYTHYLGRNPSTLISNVNVEVQLVFSCLIKPAFIIIADTFVVLFIFILLLLVSPAATLTSMIALGLSGGVFLLLSKRKLSKLGTQRKDLRAQMIQWTNQSLGSLKELLVANKQSFFANRFGKLADTFVTPQTFYETITQLPRLVIETVGVITLLLVTLFILLENNDFLPTLSLFAMAAFRLMPAFHRITTCASKVKFYSSTLDGIYGDLTATSTQPAPPSDSTNLPFEQCVVLDKVSFTYDNAAKPALNAINITIHKGRSVGILGSSGAGKTTLIDVILGLLPPSSGTIKVDGTNIYDNLASWRKYISYMPQQVYLTDDTIRRNIAFGIEDELIDDQHIHELLSIVQLDEYINQQPDGLSTIIGDRGAKLSGGQRQRIGLARALYSRPEILVLDEATAGLDPKTELAICQTLTAMKAHTTMIIISHQPQLAQIADDLYYIDQGTTAQKPKT